MTIPDHLTVNEGQGSADCTVCGTGVNVPGLRFGYASRTDVLAAFIVAHAVHDKRGRPDGLTPSGRARPAAARVLQWAVTNTGTVDPLTSMS